MRFAANLSILFPERPLLERPAAAAAHGFDAVETWWPFDVPVPPPRATDDLVDAIGAAGVRLVLLNLYLGDAAAGQHGLLATPADGSAFRDNLDVAVDLAARMGVRVVNSHFGTAPPASRPEDLVDTAVDNLALAAPRVAAAGATLVVEALNPFDFPRYGLHGTAAAVTLCRAAGSAAGVPVRVLFDVYHAARAGEPVVDLIRAHAADIGHVQIADVPGRGRPGSGHLDWPAIFAALTEVGYDGDIGLEYHPSTDSDDTFAWLGRSAFRAIP